MFSASSRKMEGADVKVGKKRKQKKKENKKRSYDYRFRLMSKRILTHYSAVEGDLEDCEHNGAGGPEGGEVERRPVEVHHQRRAYVYVYTPYIPLYWQFLCLYTTNFSFVCMYISLYWQFLYCYTTNLSFVCCNCPILALTRH